VIGLTLALYFALAHRAKKRGIIVVVRTILIRVIKMFESNQPIINDNLGQTWNPFQLFELF
jgi:hypothetical protein